MTTTIQRLPRRQAAIVADRIIDEVRPYCERVVVAGSIRRREPFVKDIEIVCVPKREPVENLFGEVIAYRDALTQYVDDCRYEHGRFDDRLDKNGRPAYGERYKRLMFGDWRLDLFSVIEPAQFGVIYAIRTGPAEFSHRLVTQKRFGGYLPNHWLVKDGALYDGDGQLVPTPEEADVFRAIGLDWLDPTHRT